MLTVNVCSEMSATPRTAGPVVNSTGKRPTDRATVLCAGQNRSGTHCTTLSSLHSNVPVIGGVVVIVTARSAAPRSETGAPKVTTTGCATPTTAPPAGSTDSMANSGGWGIAAGLTATGPAAAVTTLTASARIDRTAARIASSPSRWPDSSLP